MVYLFTQQIQCNKTKINSYIIHPGFNPLKGKFSDGITERLLTVSVVILSQKYLKEIFF